MKTTCAFLFFTLLSSISWANVVFCEDDNAIDCNTCNDYVALRALYLSTNGDNWINNGGNTGWPTAAQFISNPTSPPSGYEDFNMWEGIKANSATGEVIRISLGNQS